MHIKEILSSNWFTISFNLLLCAAVFFYGLYQTKKQKQYSESKGSYQLRAYIPTIWTSLGILGTFVSILFSLFIFTILGSDNINGLIYNIAPAFSTSIIGIIGSIWTSLSNKRYLASIESEEERSFKQLQKDNNIASKGMSFSPEEILLNILKEIKDGRKKATEENGRLIREMTSSFEKNKGSIVSLQNYLGEKHDNLSAIIKQESVNTRIDVSNAFKKQKEDFERVVNDLKNKFDSTISEQNRILESKLNSLNSTLGQKIDSMISKTEGIMDRLVTVTEQSLALESEKRNKELHDFIEEEDKNIRAFINEQFELYKGINGNMDTIASDIRKLFEEDVRQTIEQFAEHEHKISAETITLCNNKLIEDAGDYLNNHMSAISVYLSNLDNQTKTTYESFKETVNAIAQTIASKLQELYNQQTSLIGGTIDTNKGQIEAALSTNSENIKLILDANKEAIESVSKEIKADNSSIKDELAAAQRRWKEKATEIEREHLDEIKSIHTDAEKVIQEILTKITNYDSSIQQMLGNIKNELIASVDVFKDKIKEIEEFIIDNNKGLQTDLRTQIHDAFQIKELEIACSKLKNGIDSTINSLNANTSEITSNLSAINASLGSSSKTYIDTVVNSNDLLTYINETLLVDKENITSVAVILSEMETLKKVAAEIEESIKRIQSMQGVETGKSIRGKKQEL